MRKIKLITTHVSGNVQASVGFVEGEQYRFFDMAANISAFGFSIAFRISPQEYDRLLSTPRFARRFYNCCARGERNIRILGGMEKARGVNELPEGIEPEWMEFHHEYELTVE